MPGARKDPDATTAAEPVQTAGSYIEPMFGGTPNAGAFQVRSVRKALESYFDRIESDANGTEQKFANYTDLVERVREVFGDDLKASTWLSVANDDFGGKTPLQAAYEANYNVIALEPVLIRIEHGIDF